MFALYRVALCIGDDTFTLALLPANSADDALARGLDPFLFLDATAMAQVLADELDLDLSVLEDDPAFTAHEVETRGAGEEYVTEMYDTLARLANAEVA